MTIPSSVQVCAFVLFFEPHPSDAQDCLLESLWVVLEGLYVGVLGIEAELATQKANAPSLYYLSSPPV